MKHLTILLALLLAVAGSAQAQTTITTTTLATAVTSTTSSTITVASATGITANQTVLFVGGAEFMTVTGVNGVAISVARSKRPVTHNVSVTVWVVPNNATVSSNPVGSCVRGVGLARYTLTFNMSTGDISACRLAVLAAGQFNWRTTNAYDSGTPSLAPPQTP